MKCVLKTMFLGFPFEEKINLRVRWGGGQWRKMANNGEKWRIMAMANSAFSFVKFAIFRQFLILEFHI